MASHKYQQIDAALEQAEKHLIALLPKCENESPQSSDTCLTQSSPGQGMSFEMQAAILTYAEAANNTITSRILNLPRELRDTIYMHLWEPDSRGDPNRNLLYWWEHFDEPWIRKDRIPMSSTSSTNISNLRPPHFVDQTFVGRLFAVEVLKWFKDSIGKDLRPHRTYNPIAECLLLDASMEAFVKKDAFGVGITVEELTRNLDLNIDFQCDALENEEDDAGKENEKYLHDLDNGSSALLNMPYTNRMIIYDQTGRNIAVRPRIITFAIRQECSTSIKATLVPILKLVLRAYKGLKAKGFTVKVRYHSEELGLKVTFDEATTSWTDEDWHRNQQEKNASRVDPAEVNAVKQGLVWKTLREKLFTVRTEDNNN